MNPETRAIGSSQSGECSQNRLKEFKVEIRWGGKDKTDSGKSLFIPVFAGK